MYKTDHKNLRAKIKNLEQRLDFQRYNIREKQKEKGRKKEKEKELLKNKQTNKQTIKNKTNKQKKTINNPPKTVYGVCLKKKKKSF